MSATAGYQAPAAQQDRARPGRLAGRAIVVTRPASQAVSLASLIREAGGEPVLFPTIEILDAADPARLQSAVAQLADYAWAFFVSPNAVEKTFAHVSEWPAAVRVAAVGPGTRAALNQRGVREVLTPVIRFDSEGLMQMPELADVAGLRCVIFRGNGGRELIASTLIERGAGVDLVECYRRALPRTDTGPLLARWAQGGIDAVTFTSSEGLHNFVELAGASAREIYSATPAFVPHPRIAATAASFGFRQVIETGAADAGLLAALDQHLGRD
jgi:uroporphyrinogen-III synthase